MNHTCTDVLLQIFFSARIACDKSCDLHCPLYNHVYTVLYICLSVYLWDCPADIVCISCSVSSWVLHVSVLIWCYLAWRHCEVCQISSKLSGVDIVIHSNNHWIDKDEAFLMQLLFLTGKFHIDKITWSTPKQFFFSL